MKKVLITGSTGFLGSALLSQLSNEYDVIRTVQSNFHSKTSTHRLAICDICDYESISEMVSRCDIIVHLAGIVGEKACSTDIRKAVTTNIKGTLNILDAMRVHNKIGIYAGVGNASDNTAYSITKSTAESFVHMFQREYKIKMIPVRIFNLYGPGQDINSGKLIPENIKRGLSGEPLTLFGEGKQLNDFIYIHDGAALLKHLVNRLEHIDNTEELHIGTSESTTVKEMITMIQKLTGSKSEIQFFQDRAGTVQTSVVADTDKIVMPPDFTFTSLSSGLEKTINYIRGNQNV